MDEGTVQGGVLIDGRRPARDRGRASSTGLPAIFRIFALIAFSACVLFAGGFIWFANHVSALATPRNPERADAIIVLTGGHFRLNAALDLLKSGKGERLLISGVNPIARSRDIQVATGADPRLFSCCVDIDHEAVDTVGNAEESAKWVRAHDYASIILVTSNYHMPRSLLEVRRQLHDAKLKPYPVVNTPIDEGEWISQPDTLRVLFIEYAKYLAAVARGLLAPEPPVPDVAPEIREAPVIEAKAPSVTVN